MSFEFILIIAASLLLVSVLISKISDRSGIPALLLFLAIGMLAGSDGLGGIYFDDPTLAQFIGIVALNLILFAGGLDTDWKDVRPVLKQGVALSTLGVLITAVIVGIAAQYLLEFTLYQGLLLGAIVSSTDAAAVFSILRSKSLGLKGKLRPLLELESGSNDPMAAFLTIGMIQLLTQPNMQVTDLVGVFFLQMIVGALCGFFFGRLLAFLANRTQLGYEGLYPVLTLSIVFLAYSVTSLLKGNGFLAVYIAGIVAGHQDFVHRRSLIRFHDGIAWLMQITMFLTLGLLVFPTEIPPIITTGLLVATSLIFLARPVSIFLTLLPTSLTVKEKAFISWVGLRGAVPIILATYPLLARLPQADSIFNIVFFVVLTSAMVQGASIPYVAKWLGVDMPVTQKPIYPIEFTPVSGFKSELKELTISAGSIADGKPIVELYLPQEFLIILIARENEFILPSGGITLHAGDTLIVLADKETFAKVEDRLNTKVSD
ncbi:MAG: potassium/proton antiporter [Chloroflexota bacterium]|nr:potassium/proton antiporter [Chloroflexota bacterium]MBI5704277.1 potassium/proton antiporter [Chloroflexota bacterium]